MKSKLLLLVVYLAATIVELVVGAAIFDTVSQRLEKFAKSGAGSSGVTYDELEAAHDEVKDYGQKWRDDMRKAKDSFRLLDDFVFIPMDSWRPSEELDDEHEQVEKLKQSYLRRAEQAYRQFWPAYVDKKLIIDTRQWRVSKFNQLVEILCRKTKGQITPRLLWHCKLQLDLMRNKLDEMVHHEDIFSRLDDYHNMLNFINSDSTKVIKELCLANVNRESDITEEGAANCARQFRPMFGINQDD